MRRRSAKTNQIILWIISFLVIAGMLCGALVSVLAPNEASSMLPAIALGAALI